jgi:hypothetical protein
VGGASALQALSVRASTQYWFFIFTLHYLLSNWQVSRRILSDLPPIQADLRFLHPNWTLSI